MDERPVQRMKYRFMYLICHQDSGAWDQSTAKRLSHHDHVRLYFISLSGQELAGPTHPCLYLVQNEQSSVGLAEFLNTSEIIRRRQNNATFTLNRLEDHGCDRFGLQPVFHGRQISERNFGGSASHRPQALAPEVASHSGKRA